MAERGSHKPQVVGSSPTVHPWRFRRLTGQATSFSAKGCGFESPRKHRSRRLTVRTAAPQAVGAGSIAAGSSGERQRAEGRDGVEFLLFYSAFILLPSAINSGCSSAWPERSPRAGEAEGSNPSTQTVCVQVAERQLRQAVDLLAFGPSGVRVPPCASKHVRGAQSVVRTKATKWLMRRRLQWRGAR